MKHLHATTKWIIVIIAISVIQHLNGQTKPIQKKQPTPVNSKNTVIPNTIYLSSSFNRSLTKIPISFNGHNPIELYNNLHKRTTSLTKDEFESTAQFEQKLQIEKSKPIIGKLNEDSLFALIPNEIRLHYSGFKYNADSMNLELAFELEAFKNYKNQSNKFDFSRKGIELQKKITEKRNYDGMNIFGVSTQVYSEKSNVYSLLFDNWTDFVNGGVTNDLIKFNFKVDPIVAKKVKENNTIGVNSILSAIIIGNVSKPYVCEGYYYSGTPTLSEAYEYEEKINYINFSLSEIWIYNKITGEILTKINPQKKMICDINSSFGNRKLKSNIPTFDLFEFTEEGVMTFNVGLYDFSETLSGDFEISTPTTLTNKLLQYKAHDILRKLKFDISNPNSTSKNEGTITLTFKRDK